MAIYDKPVRFLMRDMVHDLDIPEGQIISKEQVIAWFKEHYPKIKKGTISAHLIRLSTNARTRIHYNAKPGEDDLFFQINGSHFRLYQRESDPPPIYEEERVLQEEKVSEQAMEV